MVRGLGSLNQSDLSGEEFLHHALLHLPGFGELGFEGGDLRIHVTEYGGDVGLFMKSTGVHSSDSRRLPFFRLHGPHSDWRFPRTVRPPRAIGMT